MRRTTAEDIAGAKLIFDGAQRLLARPAAWTTRAEARDFRGKRTNAWSDNARSYCAIGAMRRNAKKAHVSNRSWSLALKVMRQALGGSIWHSNDRPGGYRRIMLGFETALVILDSPPYSDIASTEAMWIGSPRREIRVVPAPVPVPTEKPARAPQKPAEPIEAPRVPDEPLVPA